LGFKSDVALTRLVRAYVSTERPVQLSYIRLNFFCVGIIECSRKSVMPMKCASAIYYTLPLYLS
jgi:hypothetical protein